MQKRAKSHGKHIQPVRLYLDDVETIYEILREVAERVRIINDEHVLDKPDQLLELKKDCLTYLEISSSEPYISVDLKPSSCWLYIANDESTSRGVFEKTKQLLERRKPLFWFIYTLPFNALLSVSAGICLGSLVLPTTGLTDMSQSVVALNVAGALVAVLWGLYNFHVKFNKHSVVFLTHRSSTQSFLKRNRDQIILALTSAILGGVVTFFISKFTGTE